MHTTFFSSLASAAFFVSCALLGVQPARAVTPGARPTVLADIGHDGALPRRATRRGHAEGTATHRRATPTASPPAAASALPAPVPAKGGDAAEAAEPVEAADVTQVSVAGDAAADDRSTWYGEAWPMFDRVIDAYTARTSRKNTFNTLIAHRNSSGFARAPFDTLLGFDEGLLKIGLGLRYGILDAFDAGIFRMNGTFEIFDTYEFDLRYQFLKQEQLGVDLALRVGFSWFAQPGDNRDSVAPFVSLLVDRVIANRALVGLSMLYHQNSSGPYKTNQDSSASVAVQIYTDVRITQGLSLALEFTQPFAGYHDFNPNVTFGPRFITNRHTFAIVLSNTQYYDADGIVTGNRRTSIRDWVLGFNITREL